MQKNTKDELWWNYKNPCDHIKKITKNIRKVKTLKTKYKINDINHTLWKVPGQKFNLNDNISIKTTK